MTFSYMQFLSKYDGKKEDYYRKSEGQFLIKNQAF